MAKPIPPLCFQCPPMPDSGEYEPMIEPRGFISMLRRAPLPAPGADAAPPGTEDGAYEEIGFCHSAAAYENIVLRNVANQHT